MHHKILISVIIPVYNAEAYLRQCLDSVVEQTLREIEIICVDDGSTDCSLEILREYERKDPRVQVLSQKNQYAGVARNHGMDLARGDYYLFLDADDFFERNMLEELYRQASALHADICLCGADSFHTQSGNYRTMPRMLNLEEVKKQPFNAFDLEHLYSLTSPAPWNKLFSADFVHRTGLQFQSTERINDLYFSYTALALAERIAVVNQILVHYRVEQTENLQAGIYQSPEQCCVTLLAVKRRLEGEACWEHIRESFVNKAIATILYNFRCLAEYPWAQKILAEALVGGYLQALGIQEFPSNSTDEQRAYERLQRYLQDARSHEPPAPLVSVVIPVYNAEAYLRQCLDSICGQTLRDLEIICVNDGSTDGSPAILEDYQRRDFRVTVISQENKGAGGARNAGMRRAAGAFILFMDSDDYLEQTALELLTGLAAEQDLDGVLFGLKAFYTSEALREAYSYYDSYYKREAIPGVRSGVEYMRAAREKKTYIVQPCRALWRRALLRERHVGFPEGVVHDDNLFTFRALMEAQRVLEIPDELYHRRLRPNSITTMPKSHKDVLGYFGCAMGIMDYAMRGRYAPEKEHEIWRTWREMINSALRDYRRISAEEREKVVFPRELEAELFKQTVLAMYKREEETEKRERSSKALAQKEKELRQKEAELKQKADALREKEEELRRTKRALEQLRSSTSFRIGRGMTWLPRKLRGGLRCCAQHGLGYTIRYFLMKLTGRA